MDVLLMEVLPLTQVGNQAVHLMNQPLTKEGSLAAQLVLQPLMKEACQAAPLEGLPSMMEEHPLLLGTRAVRPLDQP